MKLATTLVSYTLRRNSNNPWDSIEAVRVCKELGFDSLDIYFNKVIDLLSEEEQDEWVQQMNQAIKEAGLPICQCHAYFGKTKSLDEYKERVARSMELAGRMGIPWAVVHPITHTEEQGVTLEESIQENVEFFKRLQAVAAPGGVGVAFENIARCEYATADALIALCEEAKKYGNVGVCWDTGHANLVPDMDQVASIMRLGKLLKCTHIHDNHGKTDEHILPMMGNIEWEPLIRALKESGYEGDLVYESGQPLKHLPDDNILRVEFLKYYVKLGRYLLDIE
jgi:sugar phosphate isomerase/epimerase